jgi:hypothetical protein
MKAVLSPLEIFQKVGIDAWLEEERSTRTQEEDMKPRSALPGHGKKARVGEHGGQMPRRHDRPGRF